MWVAKYRSCYSACYKKAEGVLKKAAQSAVNIIEKAGGSGEFHRYNEQKAGS